VIQIVPQLRILLVVEPVDGRKGIDSLVAVCRNHLGEDPFSGAMFVLRTRTGTALRLFCYDGQGFWLAQKRFSTGKLRWWPQPGDAKLSPLAAAELQVLLYNGQPDTARFAPDWRALPRPLQAASRTSSSASV
jgi:transposase